MRQGFTTNPLSWKGNVDFRKIVLDYATLGRAFRNCFPYNFFPRVFINTIIVKTISSWKPLSREFRYKLLVLQIFYMHTYICSHCLYIHIGSRNNVKENINYNHHLSLIQTLPTSSTLSPTQPHANDLIANSGLTWNYMYTLTTIVHTRDPSEKPINLKFPNSATMESTHQSQI